MRAKTKLIAGSAPPVFFRRAALALAISAVFASVATVAGEKLDMSFIQGGAGV
ncbi:TPA: outer membrane usher protein faeD domain protein, partial [Escherichia coli]|nr:outer membrane usher protein faeD domain protein [Escherichia coli]HBA9809238.1 outer membrane usher protein faeD domain protein [Escherichia coli]HBA9818334.1 outer membrane usher protein faeD domain protein [Escherichia coli]